MNERIVENLINSNESQKTSTNEQRYEDQEMKTQTFQLGDPAVAESDSTRFRPSVRAPRAPNKAIGSARSAFTTVKRDKESKQGNIINQAHL